MCNYIALVFFCSVSWVEPVAENENNSALHLGQKCTNVTCGYAVDLRQVSPRYTESGNPQQNKHAVDLTIK